MNNKLINYIYTIIPLLPSIILLCNLYLNKYSWQIYISVILSISSFYATYILIPIIAEYTLKNGLYGKDLGKKGTKRENILVPEALGVVSGVVFLICAILSQLFFLRKIEYLTISNSALFSICFMIFLGFVDDTVDLKWRFKLILPFLASLPLLVSYNGFSSIYIPQKLRFLFYDINRNDLTILGEIINYIFIVDKNAEGAIIEMSYWFMLYMGFLSVFCTNAINILAGINGLGI